MMDPKQLTLLLNTKNSQLTQEQQHALEAVYYQLKKIAQLQKYKVQKHELNTTALVNEAWIKLNNKERSFNDRNHFFATSAMAMRQILLNQAQKVANRSEDNQVDVEDMVSNQTEAIWLLELERQLSKMGQYNPRLEEVFVYRYFGGMGIEEIATIMDTSPRTIDRDWKKAKLMMSVALK
jgi:RNA polymerase sigma factor (TIGR02999 family)